MLLLHRTLPAQAVVAGITAVLPLMRFDPDLVAVQARRTMLTQAAPPPPVPIPATASPAAAQTRTAPSLRDYDRLLTEVPA